MSLWENAMLILSFDRVIWTVSSFTWIIINSLRNILYISDHKSQTSFVECTPKRFIVF